MPLLAPALPVTTTLTSLSLPGTPPPVAYYYHHMYVGLTYLPTPCLVTVPPTLPPAPTFPHLAAPLFQWPAAMVMHGVFFWTGTLLK